MAEWGGVKVKVEGIKDEESRICEGEKVREYINSVHSTSTRNSIATNPIHRPLRATCHTTYHRAEPILLILFFLSLQAEKG